MADISVTTDNLHIRPEMLLKTHRVERIRIEKDTERKTFFEIIKFVDLDGKDIYIPRLCDLGKDGELDEMLQEHGFSKSIEKSMTDNEKERFDYARHTLKLPDLLAVHATFRKDLDLKEFAVPEEGTGKTNFISIIGDPGSGKSLLTAILSMKEDLPPFTFDRYSAIGPKEYIKFINEEGLDKNSSIEELWKIGIGIRNSDSRPEQPTQTMPLSQNLDEMLEYFKDGERPEYVFIEGVADSSNKFSSDVVFLATRDSCEARIWIDPCNENKIGLLYYPDGKQVYPPILRVAFKVDSRPESRSLNFMVVEELMERFKEEKVKILKFPTLEAQ